MIHILNILLFILFKNVHSDIYLHNPRGSNNRLDEQGRERNNANRMFDSQNNNRGGYNAGYMYYYAGSTLRIEWSKFFKQKYFFINQLNKMLFQDKPAFLL